MFPLFISLALRYFLEKLEITLGKDRDLFGTAIPIANDFQLHAAQDFDHPANAGTVELGTKLTLVHLRVVVQLANALGDVVGIVVAKFSQLYFVGQLTCPPSLSNLVSADSVPSCGAPFATPCAESDSAKGSGVK